MCRLLILITFLPQINFYAQIDPRKVDSLAQLIDSSAGANRKQQESLIKSSDSNYQFELNKALQQGSENRYNFSVEQKRIEERNRLRIIVRIVAGVLLLLTAVIALVQWKKRNT